MHFFFQNKSYYRRQWLFVFKSYIKRERKKGKEERRKESRRKEERERRRKELRGSLDCNTKELQNQIQLFKLDSLLNQNKQTN